MRFQFFGEIFLVLFGFKGVFYFKIEGEFSILDVFLFKGSSQIKLKVNSQFSIIVCLFVFKRISCIKSFSNLFLSFYQEISFIKFKLFSLRVGRVERVEQ